MAPIVPLGKRKRPVYAESSSDDDAPLASSSPVKPKSAAVPMPGALNATTLAVTSVNGNRQTKKADSDKDDYDDDQPVVKKKKSAVNSKAKVPAKKKVKKEDTGPDAEDDEPGVKKKRAPRKKKVQEESDDAESEDDKPVEKKPTKAQLKQAKVKKEDGSGSDTPKPKKRKAKKAVEVSPKKSKAKAKEEAEEDVYRWWEAQDPNGDGTEKWKTLVHSGVIFPPPYEPLPPQVKMKYNGVFSRPSGRISSSHGVLF